MRQLTILIEQINQCKNLIIENDTAGFRMALILLDNAAEILMYRKVLSEFSYNDMYGKICEQAKSAMPPDIFEKFLSEHAIPEILAEKRKRGILKYFDEKVTFLCDTSGFIPIPVAAVLSSLHRYRNETYHRDIIRIEILRPIAILYFELVCELLTYLKHGSISYSGEDDWSPFFKKYGLGDTHNKFRMLGDEDIDSILNRLRAELSVNLHELRVSLQEYLMNRLDETINRLNFVSDALGIKASNATLKFVQYIREDNSRKYDNRDVLLNAKEFINYLPPISEDDFSNWRTRTHQFVNVQDKLTLFMAFKDIEDQFEPIEHRIHDTANELDSAIQFAIDLARGK